MKHAMSWFGGGKGKTYFLNLHRPKSQYWKVREIGGNNDIATSWEGREFNVSEGLTGYMIKRYESSFRKEPFLLHNLERAKTKYGYIEAVPNGESVMIASLVHADKIYGVIAVVSDRKFEFSEKDKDDLALLAEMSADAIVRTGIEIEKSVEEKKSDSTNITIHGPIGTIGSITGKASNSQISTEQEKIASIASEKTEEKGIWGTLLEYLKKIF